MHYQLDTATTWRVNEKSPSRARSSAKIESTPEATAIADRDLILSVMGPDFNEDDADGVLSALTCNPVITREQLNVATGIDLITATRIVSALELGRRQIGKRHEAGTPEKIFQYIRHYGDRMQEHFIVVLLNGAMEIMGVNVVTVGLINRTLVHPREVFADAIKQRATAIVIAHNHPSGNIEPSADDMEVTENIRKAGNILGIKLLDHLVFSLDNYYSFLESGQLYN